MNLKTRYVALLAQVCRRIPRPAAGAPNLRPERPGQPRGKIRVRCPRNIPPDRRPRPGLLSRGHGQHLRGRRHLRGQARLHQPAIEEYKLALNADPGSPELNDALADLYFRVPGRVHDAEATARGLLKTSPDDIEAHKLLGRIYLRQLGEGENAGASASATSHVLDQAIAEFEKIVALTPKSVEDRMVLGQLYTVKHDSKKAEEQFKTAQAIEPESEEVVLNLARLYAESGDLQHAAKVIEDVPVNDRTAKMEFSLGAAYDQMKQPKDAISAYERAADMDPGDPHTIDALAQALMSNNQLDEALKQYRAAQPGRH